MDTTNKHDNLTEAEREKNKVKVQNFNHSINVNRTLTVKQNLSNWCVPGESFVFPGDEASKQSVIIGYSNYSDQEVCHANVATQLRTVNKFDFEIQIDYYFTQNAQKVWVVSTVDERETVTYIEQ